MGTATLLTEAEFLALPEVAGKQELLDGELLTLPPPTLWHSEMIKRLQAHLETVLDRSRVWSETAYRMRPGRWLIPDLSVSWPDQPRYEEWFQASPMVAVEIASRGNTAAELEQKVVAYLEHGAAEVWVVYPKTRTMTVHRKGAAVRVGAEDDYRCDVLGLTVGSGLRAPAL
jgi:Uma2 family endonuclease